MGMGKGDPRCAAIGNLGMGIETPSLRERVNIFVQRSATVLVRGVVKFVPALA